MISARTTIGLTKLLELLCDGNVLQSTSVCRNYLYHCIADEREQKLRLKQLSG